jgi:hypothetical protein
MFNTDPKFRYAVSQDIRNITKSNPEMLNQLQDPETFKRFLSEQYADVIKPVIYSQEYTSPTNIKTESTVVNNMFPGEGGDVPIYYDKAIDGYNFSGIGGKGKSKPIPYQGVIPSELRVYDGKNYTIVSQDKQPPEAAFNDAELTGIKKIGGKVYAAVSVPKVEEYQTDSGTKTRRAIERQVYYIPYGLAETSIKQSGYVLQDWEKFYEGEPEAQSAWTTPGKSGSMLND